jgi:hypothetical protein
MLCRSRVRSLARIVLAALLFSQAAIGAAACDMPDRSPAMAFEDEVVMPCHQAPAQYKNLCLAHCLSADQSADTPQVVVPAWSGAASLIVAIVENTSTPVVAPRRMTPRAAAPPPRILFQSFLI